MRHIKYFVKGATIVVPIVCFFSMVPAFDTGHYIVGGILLGIFALFLAYFVGFLLEET